MLMVTRLAKPAGALDAAPGAALVTARGIGHVPTVACAARAPGPAPTALPATDDVLAPGTPPTCPRTTMTTATTPASAIAGAPHAGVTRRRGGAGSTSRRLATCGGVAGSTTRTAICATGTPGTTSTAWRTSAAAAV